MSHFWIITLPAMLIAWLLGSVSSAILVCRLMNLPDPRTDGSGNPGTTNVLRIGGKKAAALTLAGDVLKGWLPVMIAKYIHLDPLTIGLVALAAFLGHLYPAFFQLKGGKGVATGFGCLSALAWPLGLTMACTWLLVAVLFRYSSLAAIVTALLAPLYAAYFLGRGSSVFIILIMSALLLYRHRSNIYKLYRGDEKKIGQRSN